MTPPRIEHRNMTLIKPRGEGDILELELDTSPPTVLRIISRWRGDRHTGQFNWSAPTKEDT